MEPHSHKTSKPQDGRRRSRSPATSRSQDETGSPSQQRPRTRSLSPASRFLRAPQMMEENEEKWAAADGAWEAERERRRNLNPMERLREDGQKLQDEILSDQNMLVTFEESRSARAQCRAEEDCIFVLAEIRTGKTITSKFRIRVDGVKDGMFWRPATHYYHVVCFDQMVDLEDLIPTKFRLDPQTSWGLLIRKWFEHKGCISLDKISTYIEAYKAYQEKLSDFSTMWIKWSLDHGRRCEDDQATCTCPPKPQPPEKPVLKDYKTGEEGRCSLGDVMKHPNFDDMRDELRFIMGVAERVNPETEGQSEQSGRSSFATDANDETPNTGSAEPLDNVMGPGIHSIDEV